MQNTKQPKVSGSIQSSVESAIQTWYPGLEGIELIRAHKVWDSTYRVDVFTKSYEEASHVPQYRIEVSHLLQERDGRLVDITAGGSNRSFPIS